MISGVVYAQSFEQEAKIVASDRNVADSFGRCVGFSNGIAVIGANNEDEDENGENTMSAAGSVYVFGFEDGEWVQQQKMVASDRATADEFGSSVAISNDYMVVAAYKEDEDADGATTLEYSGSAYVFEKDDNGTWSQVQKIVADDRAANDYFAYSVGISGDYIIVGAYVEDEDETGNNTLSSAGSAYIFERDASGTWIQVQKIVANDRAEDDFFGYDVAISGDYAVVSAAPSSYVYVFERDDSGTWSQVQKIASSDRDEDDYFGKSVSIYNDQLIVGAYKEDENEDGSYNMSSAGSAYIFERDDTGTWSQLQKIVASDRDSEDYFGTDVAICESYAIVGAYFEDDDEDDSNSKPYAGSAYIFEKNEAGTWEQLQKLVSDDRAMLDYAGYSVAASDTVVIFSATGQDYDEDGSSYKQNGGAAYIFSNQTYYTITASAGTGGSIDPDGASIVTEGGTITYTITVSDDYMIDDVLVNDVSVGSVDTYVFSNVDEDATIEAIFSSSLITAIQEEEEDSYDISIYPNPASDYIVVDQNLVKESYNQTYFYNVSGQLKMVVNTYDGENKIDIQNLSKGIYILKVGDSFISKLIIH
jgi:hypothetical protein